MWKEVSQDTGSPHLPCNPEYRSHSVESISLLKGICSHKLILKNKNNKELGLTGLRVSVVTMQSESRFCVQTEVVCVLSRGCNEESEAVRG